MSSEINLSADYWVIRDKIEQSQNFINRELKMFKILILLLAQFIRSNANLFEENSNSASIALAMGIYLLYILLPVIILCCFLLVCLKYLRPVHTHITLLENWIWRDNFCRRILFFLSYHYQNKKRWHNSERVTKQTNSASIWNQILEKKNSRLWRKICNFWRNYCVEKKLSKFKNFTRKFLVRLCEKFI